MPKEIELKLRVTSEEPILTLIKTMIPDLNFEPIELKNVYLDTPDLRLNTDKVALRLRYHREENDENHGEHSGKKSGEKVIQTLKTKGRSINGLHQRGEWEWPIAGSDLDVELLQECDAWPTEIDATQVIPVFETNFTRYRAQIYWGNSKMELAYDKGEILANGLTEIINEIELELISGNTNDIVELGNLMQTKLPVEQYNVSKAERGYHLYSKSKTAE